MSSVLQNVLPFFQPALREITRFRVKFIQQFSIPLSGVDGTLFMSAFTEPPPYGLNRLYEFTRWPIMQKVHRHFAHLEKVFLKKKIFQGRLEKSHEKYEVSIVCKFWISGFYFTPLKRVLFTFPSRYLFTIGQRRILRLWGWSPNLQARKFALLFLSRKKMVIQGFHLLWQDFSIFSEFFFFLKLSNLFRFREFMPFPGSLATTTRISVDL